MSHLHAWSRWIKGRHTGLYIRTCRLCGAQEHTDQAPEQPPLPQVKAGDPESVKWMDLRAGQMARTPQTFNRFRVAADVKKKIQEARKHVRSAEIVDWRTKQAGS